jgi:hypothetical protein
VKPIASAAAIDTNVLGSHVTTESRNMSAAATAVLPEVPTAKPEEPLLTNEFEKRIGISSKTLQKIFDQDVSKLTGPQKTFVDMVAARLRETRLRNLREFRTYAAIDSVMYDATSSITPTLLNKLSFGSLNDEAKLLEGIKNWQLNESDFFEIPSTPTSPSGANSAQMQRVRKNETFWKVRIPLVKAIVDARVAKLFVERDRVPWLPCDPLIWTEESHLKCQILTNLLERMVQQYGLKSSARTALLQAAMYNNQLVFIREAWHHEQDMEDGKKRTKKEGLRFFIPHPSRMGWDLVHPISSFNTDTGCTWAAHWYVDRYGAVLDDPKYWNKDRISYGTCWFHPTVSWNYFQEVYPCTANVPHQLEAWYNAEANGDRAFQSTLYTSNQRDNALFLADMAVKVVPSRYELGDYDCPLWFRLVIASDSAITFAEPLPDCPVMFCGWDTDESRSTQASLALLAMPHQDFVQNLVSQHRLTVKQNLVKIVWYDKDSEGVTDAIKNIKAEAHEYNHVLWVPFSARKFKQAGIDPQRIFHPITFGYQDTTSLIVALNTYLSLMERVLGMSANEFGVNAPRVTTAAETTAVGQQSTTRLTYTGGFFDDFLDTLKRRVIRYWAAFGDSEFTTHVVDADEDALKVLNDLGFDVGKGSTMPAGGKRHSVKGKKELLDVDDFVSERTLANRMVSQQLANVMIQLMQLAVPFINDGSPGAREQLIELINRAAPLLGAPKDYKFLPPRPPEEPTGAIRPPLKIFETIRYDTAPPDVQAQIEAQAGLVPSKMREAAFQQQANAKEQAPKTQDGQGAPPPQSDQLQQMMAQAVQVAVQESMQAVNGEIGPALQKIQARLTQVTNALIQTKQDEQTLATHIGQLEQVIATLAQPPSMPSPAPSPMEQMPPQ